MHEQLQADPVAELRALSARLAQLVDAVESTVVEAEVDAVSARVASVDAVAAEQVATRHAAGERRAGLAAQEAAEVAEDLANAAGQERDRATAQGVTLTRRALEAEAWAAAEVERVMTLLRAATVEAQVRIGRAVADAADRVERAIAHAAEVRADAEARIDTERSARIAAQSLADALTGERDRLVAQLAAQTDREAVSLAALAMAVRAAEDRRGTSALERPPAAD